MVVVVLGPGTTQGTDGGLSQQLNGTLSLVSFNVDLKCIRSSGTNVDIFVNPLIHAQVYRLSTE